MNGLFEAARESGAFMDGQDWPFCVIGGLAVQHWGEPRTTLDVDMALFTGWGDEARFVDTILEGFASRIEDGRAFALAHRVLLITASNGKPVDITLAALPFEAEMIRQAPRVAFAPDLALPCCTAEDLFIMKAFAGRPRDWVDAESVAARQRTLDTGYILEHLAALCALKECPEHVDRAQMLLEKHA